MRKFAVTMTLAVILLLVMPVQARGGGDGDSPFKALHDAGLIKDLDQQQTQGGFTAVLHWVYADTNILAADISLTGLAAPTDPDESAIAHYRSDITLADPQGNLFSSQNMTSEIVEAEDGTNTLTTTVTFYTQALTPAPEGENWAVINDYFNTTYGDDLPETINLRLEAKFNYYATPDTQTPDVIGPFAYDVTIPLYPAISLEPHLTDHTGDLNVTLDKVHVTPLETAITFCFDLPDGSDWQPEMTLKMGETEAQISGWGMTQFPTNEDIRRCFDASFTVVYDQQPTEFTFTLERLRVSEPSETPEFWDKVQAELIKQGIEVEFTLNYGMSYTVISKPEGMTDDDVWNAIQAARLSLCPTTEGPWTFTFSVPAS